MSTPNNPFKNLTREQRDLIENAHKSGQSPEQIGIQFGLDYDDVRFYLENFLVPPRSHFERLQEIVDDLEDQCQKTKRAIDGGSDSAMMLQSYQRLMAEYRLGLAELMELKQPQDTVDEIIEKVFNPFIVKVIRACTEETNNLKEEMLKLDISSRDAAGISTEIFKRLAERLTTQLPEAKELLDAHFGVKSKNREDSLKETLQ